MGRLGPTELLLILAIVLVLFGGRKIPEIARGLGEGIRHFREGIHGPEKNASDKPTEEKKS
jgi:sec-independent protein translocase protein TatA